jgi:hypothetical protein
MKLNDLILPLIIFQSTSTEGKQIPISIPNTSVGWPTYIPRSRTNCEWLYSSCYKWWLCWAELQPWQTVNKQPSTGKIVSVCQRRWMAYCACRKVSVFFYVNSKIQCQSTRSEIIKKVHTQISGDDWLTTITFISKKPKIRSLLALKKYIHKIDLRKI